MTLEWESQPRAHECFKGHMKLLKLWVRFYVRFSGELEPRFLYWIYHRASDPTNVKNLCIIASGGLDQMDMQASHGVA